MVVKHYFYFFSRGFLRVTSFFLSVVKMQQSHYANNYTQINSLTMLSRVDTSGASEEGETDVLSKYETWRVV
jgi:hypothetical protein